MTIKANDRSVLEATLESGEVVLDVLLNGDVLADSLLIPQSRADKISASGTSTASWSVCRPRQRHKQPGSCSHHWRHDHR